MVNKLTNNVKPLDEVDKINEIIDELGNIDPLPSQAGNANKFLTTDGTDASWSAVPTRNIGEIVSSTIPLTDAGLHLLDGALIQGDGIYSAFVDYIAGLVSTYPSVFTTESAWQSSVSTYGVCGKFVYDSTNNTVRLPKITGILEGTTDVNALGDLVQAGLPNITGSLFPVVSNGTATTTWDTKTGVFSNSNGNSAGAANTGSIYAYRRIDFNASNSNPIYGNSSTVQPQTIKCYYYIVIATSTKTDIEIDIDNVVTDLNDKVNKSGDTMSGSLRVNSVLQATGGLDLISNAVTKGTNPSSAAYWGMRFNDGSNSSDWKATRLGVIECSLDTSGTTQLLIGAYKNEANATGTASIKLKCKADGATYFEFPRCTTKATTTSSAAYDRVAVVVQNYVNGTSWYRVWSDGWIEQGGYVQNSNTTVSFLKPFTSINYTLTFGSHGGDGVPRVVGKNTNSFVYSSANVANIPCNWYACGY